MPKKKEISLVDKKIDEYLSRAEKMLDKERFTDPDLQEGRRNLGCFVGSYGDALIALATMIQTEELRIIKWIEGAQFKHVEKK